ncbi:MAG: hypothetical protein ACXABD_01230 [Candidatus Thorarchaeota archaeon]|jgi:hypothetical protein
MVTTYITAHGRAETETDTVVNLGERDIYIGQESGNCSIQSKEHDRELLKRVINWNNVAKWLGSGARVSTVEHEDYKIGTYMFEEQAEVVYTATSAIVGPTRKRNKIMNMEGKADEISKPGIVIIIQERHRKNAQLETSTIRSVLNKIYTRHDCLGKDPTGAGHRFSAIYFNNQLIEPNNKAPKNILSDEFNKYVVSNNELSLSDIIETTKSYASQIIGLKPNNKAILYAIADTTCNVYATEDIDETPSADQDEQAVVKSMRKAKTLAALLDTGSAPSLDDVDPRIVAVTPNHESGFWFTMKPEARRLRMRPTDKPGKIADPVDDMVEDDEDTGEQPKAVEYPTLEKLTRKKAPKKKHHFKKPMRTYSKKHSKKERKWARTNK